MYRFVRVGSLIAALLLAAGCGPARRALSPPPADLQWNPQDAMLPGRAMPVEPKVAAMGEFVTGEVALNEGNYDVGLKSFRAAVGHDPESPLLRQRLAMLLVRKSMM